MGEEEEEKSTDPKEIPHTVLGDMHPPRRLPSEEEDIFQEELEDDRLRDSFSKARETFLKEVQVQQVPKKILLQQLHVAAMEGNWDDAKEILDKNPDAKTAKLSNVGMTALHVAASCGRSAFVEKLVEGLTTEQLELRDQVRRTALHHVALAADVTAAKALVSKNPKLPLLEDMHRHTPLFYAARWRHPAKSREMLEYLYEATTKTAGDPPPSFVFTNPSAPNLIVGITASGSHDIALSILQKYHELALKLDENRMSILHSLAMQSSAFDNNGTELPLMQKLICPWRIKQQYFKGKKKRKDALDLVHFICKELQKKSTTDVLNFFFPSHPRGSSKAILDVATVHGAFELIKVCLRYFPDLIWYVNGEKKLLLHVAIEHRRVKIFNHVIHLIGENTKAYVDVDENVENKNNILHLAAKLAPASQLNSVRGPAFQMQREMQWYKAVEKLVYNEKREAENKEGKTPRQLFFDSHQELIQKAKEWMKDTSNSCMLVATLVATVAFAAMITVPGGNDSGTGKPLLSKKRLFLVFSVSDAVSMISSAFALLMFLSVQTSRYTEDDFLELLPKTLLKGLASLFLAVTTMMIAFGTAIGLALQTRVNWAYIPITVAACFPVIIFTRLQLPLLLQTLLFTSGPGIFEGLSDQKLWWCLNKLFVYSKLSDHDHDAA